MKLDNRLTIIVAVLICGALVAGAWFLGVSPQLASASQSASQQADSDGQNAKLEAQIGALKKEKAKLPEIEARLAALQSSVPAEPGVNELLRAVSAMAISSGVTLKSFTPSALTPYAPPVTAGASTAAATAGAAPGSASASPSPSASPSASASAAPTPTAAPNPAQHTDPAVTATDFSTVPVAIVVDGSLENELRFVDAVRAGSRLVLVTGLAETTDPTTGAKELTVSGTGFVFDPAAGASSSTATTTTPTATKG